MVRNRDAKEFKMSERQTKIAGKLPFHRVFKLNNIIAKLVFKNKDKKK